MYRLCFDKIIVDVPIFLSLWWIDVHILLVTVLFLSIMIYFKQNLRLVWTFLNSSRVSEASFQTSWADQMFHNKLYWYILEERKKN